MLKENEQKAQKNDKFPHEKNTPRVKPNFQILRKNS